MVCQGEDSSHLGCDWGQVSHLLSLTFTSFLRNECDNLIIVFVEPWEALHEGTSEKHLACSKVG